MKKRRTDGAILLLALVLFAGLSYQIGARAPEDRSADGYGPRSTYSDRPDGWRAFYLMLQACGFNVNRWTKPPTAWPADASVMIVAPCASGNDWSEQEAGDAEKWVSKGGTLLLLSNERDSELNHELGLSQCGDDSEWTAAERSPVGGKKPAARLSSSQTDTDALNSNDDPGVPVAPVQPIGQVRRVHAISAPTRGGYWESVPGGTLTFFQSGDGKHPYAVAFSHGDGLVIAVAAPFVAENDHIGALNNARFLIQSVAIVNTDRKDENKEGSIYFDEYHQGYSDDETFWGVIGSSGRLIAFEILLIGVLMAYSASRRFGLPHPAPPPPRVSSEYVRSLAGLYRKARAGDAALEGIYRAFRQDLCRAVGLPIDAPVTEVASVAAAGLAGGDAAMESRLLEQMDTCEAKISGGMNAVTEPDLLKLALALEALRKDLQLGVTDHRA